MKTTTVKPRELSASDITKYALKVLDLWSFECWRQNNLAVRGRKFTGKKGLADILGFHRTTGKLMICEVKKIGDTLSDDQIELLNKVTKAGAHGFVAKQEGTEITITPYETKGEMK